MLDSPDVLPNNLTLVNLQHSGAHTNELSVTCCHYAVTLITESSSLRLLPGVTVTVCHTTLMQYHADSAVEVTGIMP